MLKLLFTGILLYLAYKMFFSPPKPKEVPPRPKEDPLRSPEPKPTHDDGEYIDYEEVD